MSKKLLFLFFFLLISFSLNAQSESDSNIEAYKNLLKSFDTTAKTRSSVADKSLVKNYASTYHNAYLSDPIKMELEKIKEANKIKNKARSRSDFRNLMKNSLKNREIELQKLLKENLTKLQYDLLTIPLIVKAKVTNREERSRKIAKGSTSEVQQTYLTIVIEDIIKAKADIKPGSKLEIMYGNSWVNNEQSWLENNSYLFFLEYRTDLKGTIVAIVTYLDGKNNGHYPIVNNQLTDNVNYLTNSRSNTWANSKQNLIETINSTLK